MLFEVLNDPAYEPFWYVGLWLILCGVFGSLFSELLLLLFRKWKRKHGSNEKRD